MKNPTMIPKRIPMNVIEFWTLGSSPIPGKKYDAKKILGLQRQ